MNSIGHGSANVANNGLNSLDEAVVCDESFTSNSTESMGDLLYAADSSSLGSGSSGISCSGRNGVSPPGPIDNSSLIEPPVYKNVRTLTGEGGRLKRNLILSEHRDYELVPESLWKALSQWHRGPLPLPRQVTSCNINHFDEHIFTNFSHHRSFKSIVRFPLNWNYTH